MNPWKSLSALVRIRPRLRSLTPTQRKWLLSKRRMMLKTSKRLPKATTCLSKISSLWLKKHRDSPCSLKPEYLLLMQAKLLSQTCSIRQRRHLVKERIALERMELSALLSSQGATVLLFCPLAKVLKRTNRCWFRVKQDHASKSAFKT